MVLGSSRICKFTYEVALGSSIVCKFTYKIALGSSIVRKFTYKVTRPGSIREARERLGRVREGRRRQHFGTKMSVLDETSCKNSLGVKRTPSGQTKLHRANKKNKKLNAPLLEVRFWEKIVLNSSETVYIALVYIHTYIPTYLHTYIHTHYSPVALYLGSLRLE